MHICVLSRKCQICNIFNMNMYYMIFLISMIEETQNNGYVYNKFARKLCIPY